MLVKKCRPIRIESIVRGYLSGSAYSEYLKNGKVSDISIKPGLKLNDRFDVPISSWHQITNPFEEECRIIEIQYGEETSEDDIERL